MRKISYWFIDYLLLPLFLIILAYHPFYKHGLFLSWDEGSPLAWANAIQFHQVPLKDFFVTFGPLFPYLTAAGLKIFGNTIAGFRAFMFFGSLASLIGAYFLGRKLIKSRVMLAIFCWYLASSCQTPFWISKWGGLRCLAMVIPALFLLNIYKQDCLGALKWFGVVSGICFLITQEAGIVALAMFTAYVWQVQNERMRKVRAFFLPFLSIVALFYLYLGLRGASLEMILSNTIESPFAFLGYYSNPPNIVLLPFLRPFGMFVGAWLAYLQSASFDFVFSVLVYAASVVYLIKRKGEQDARLSLLIVFGLTLFIPGIRGFTGPVISGPQFHWGLLGTGILGVYLLQQVIFPLEEGLLRSKKSVLFIRSLAVIVLLFGIIFSKLTPAYLEYLREKFVRVELSPVEAFWPERFGDSRLPQWQAEEFAKVTDFIQANTMPDEFIYAFPHEPQYYFLAARRSADIFTNALDAGISNRMQKKAVTRIAGRNVNFAINVLDSYRVMDNHQVPNEERIPFIYRYFNENFAIVADINDTLILKRK